MDMTAQEVLIKWGRETGNYRVVKQILFSLSAYIRDACPDVSKEVATALNKKEKEVMYDTVLYHFGSSLRWLPQVFAFKEGDIYINYRPLYSNWLVENITPLYTIDNAYSLKKQYRLKKIKSIKSNQ